VWPLNHPKRGSPYHTQGNLEKGGVRTRQELGREEGKKTPARSQSFKEGDPVNGHIKVLGIVAINLAGPDLGEQCENSPVPRCGDV